MSTSLEGAYCARQMLAVRKEKRIGRVYHDPCALVHTAWDLGYGDSTAIWFFQICGKEVHLIEYYENSGEPLTFYLRFLKEKKYNTDVGSARKNALQVFEPWNLTGISGMRSIAAGPAIL